MLIKLIKYEFKATYKIFMGLLCLILVLGLLLVLTAEKETGNMLDIHIVRMYSFLIIPLAVVCVAAAVVPFIYAIMRFHKSLLGDEGYLYHTLPADTGSLILSKGITMLIWNLLIYGLIFLFWLWIMTHMSSLTVDAVLEAIDDPESAEMLKEFINGFLGFPLFMFILYIISAVFKWLMSLYAAMSIGYSFNTYRKVKSFLIYIAIQYAAKIAESFITAFLSVFIFNGSQTSDHIGMINMTNIVLTRTFFSIFIMTAVEAAVLFFLTRYMLKNKLNLL